MPRDLFGNADRPSPRPRRQILTMLSIALHAIVVTTIIFVQVFAVGPLPVPHRPLMFEEIRIIHLAEIQAPSRPRRTSGPASPSVSSDAVPTSEPPDIMAETGLESAIPGSNTCRCVFEQNGIGIVDSIGPFFEPVPTPAAVPPSPVRLHAGIQSPKKIADVAPAYPSVAQMAHVEGVVILEAVIDARGSVASVAVIRSSPLLDKAAIDAVRQWRYTPARLNGQAVPVIVTITVRFQMQ